MNRIVASYAKSDIILFHFWARQRPNTTLNISDWPGTRFVDIYTSDKLDHIFTASDEQPMPVGSTVINNLISAIEFGSASYESLFTMEKAPPDSRN